MNARSSQTLILLVFGYCCLSLTPAPWYAVVGLDASWAEAMLMKLMRERFLVGILFLIMGLWAI